MGDAMSISMSVSSLAPLQTVAQAPLRAVRLGAFDIAVERRPDGALLVRPTDALGPYPKTITTWLDRWAQNAPDREFLVERAQDLANTPIGQILRKRFASECFEMLFDAVSELDDCIFCGRTHHDGRGFELSGNIAVQSFAKIRFSNRVEARHIREAPQIACRVTRITTRSF